MPTLLRPALANIDAMATKAVGAMPQVLLGLLLFWVFLGIARWGRQWAERVVGAAYKHDEVGQVIGQLAYGFLVVAGVAVAAAVMGIGLGHVLAGIGVSGVVVGFAFKDILENYLAGILLMLARPFHSGDDIKTGDYEGKVRVISTRSTTIETLDGQLVVIPNSKIYSQPLTNLSALGTRRTILPLKFAVARDLAEIRGKLLAIAAGQDGVLEDPAPEVVATALEAEGVSLELRFWTRAHEADAVKGRIVEEVRGQLFAAELQTVKAAAQ